MKTNFSEGIEYTYKSKINTNEFPRPEWLDDSMFYDDIELLGEAQRLGRSFKDTVFVDRNIVVRKKSCIQVYYEWSR